MLSMMFVPLILSLQAPATPPGVSDDESGVTPARTAMQILEPLVGSFTLTAGETGTDGSAFKETGTRECRWMFDRAAIYCEDRRTLVEASGRYQRLYSHRRFAAIYRWRSPDKVFERVSVGISGAPSVTTLTAQEAGRYSYTFEVASSSFRGEPLAATSELVIERDRHVVRQELRSKVSHFAESYAETATRSSGPTR
jgi:hypothetical protein